ncbi:MAG: tyrosine--tRNA ligase [Candidatus Shikimatogenerans bostrichidophilus]|nr:MAG: tyrosine--tRNA ligase [Candidatus Shikimatogenerans bostrichidophilus]
MKNIIKELKWRNLIYNKSKNLEKFLLKKKKTIYIGFDPTFKSLHIGHLLPISIILLFYKYNYNIIIIIGEYTAKIGDISDKDKIKYISKENIKIYKKKILKQLLFFFKKKKIKIINNKKWIKKIKLFYFLNKILNKITINYLINKKFIKKKIKNKKNIYISEFIYQIIQSYDFYYLNKYNKCYIQIGGSDQWGNITTGIKIIKKINKKKVYGLTFPLLLNKKGNKFSKSNNINKNIWLNKNNTSVYNFYQYFINLSDKESIIYIKYFFLKDKKKIDNLIKKHNKNPKFKILQKKISKYITIWIHNKKEYKNIKIISKILFKKKFNFLNKKNIKIIKNNISYLKLNIKNKYNYKYIYINKIIKNNFIFKSNTEYKKFLNNNGILLINGKKIKNNIISNFKNLILNKYLIIQKGKKKFFLVKINILN